jgi:hypothetical protein
MADPLWSICNLLDCKKHGARVRGNAEIKSAAAHQAYRAFL